MLIHKKNKEGSNVFYSTIYIYNSMFPHTTAPKMEEGAILKMDDEC